MSIDLDLDIDFHNVCRCCLLPNNTLASLTAKSIVEGYLLAIPDIVEATMGVKLIIDFHRPSQICPSCKATLLGFNTFKEKSSRINTILSSVESSELDVDQDTSCRICLSTNEKLTSLKSKTIVDGNLMSLIALISECLAFEINESDEFPQKMCGSCKTQLVNFFTFREKFSRSEVTLDNVFNQPTASERHNNDWRFKTVCNQVVKHEEGGPEVDENEPSDGELMISHELPDHTERNLPLDSDTGDETIDKEGYEIIEVEDNEFGEFNADDAAIEENEQFVDDTISVDEEKTDPNCVAECAEDDRIKKEVHAAPTKAIAAPGKCKKCQKAFYGSNKSKEHAHYHKALDLVADFMDFFNCRHCTIVCTNADGLENHHHQLHSDVPYQPIERSLTKGVLQFLEDDLRTSTGNFECDVCGVCFKETVAIKNHLLVKHLEVMECSMCGISYTSLTRLASHMTLKHLNTEFRCRHCKIAEFKSYFDFKNHLKETCPARRFLCAHCDKYFLTSKSLAAHLAVAESKNFQCHCGKKFRQKGELTIHERVHTGEKNFACSICDKRYRTSSMRADHMDTHIVGKTFECTVCHIMLQTRTVLRNHLRRHTEGKTHCCQQCPKKFHTKYHLKMHVEKIHMKIKKRSLKSSFED